VVHDACWNVVLVKQHAELIPRHLMVVLKSGGIRGPPGTCEPTELLGCKQCLLELRAVKKSELRLGHAKPMVSLEWVCRLGEHPRVCCQEIEVGGILRLLLVLGTSCLALINICQPLHDGILGDQQLLQTH
jgi:hypothetical protein